MAMLLAFREELDQAEQYQRKAIELAPENPNNYTSMGHLMERQNKLDQAIYWYIKASRIDPEDPELPMQIALWLYDLDLPESGDAWAKRAIAIAPHAPTARRLKLDRTIFGGDDAEIELVAREVIAGVTEDRHWVVRTAAAELCRIHLERGTPGEAIDYLLEQYPEAADVSRFPTGGAAPMFAQIMVQMTRAMSDPSLDRAAIAQQYEDSMDAMGLGISSDPVFQNWKYLLAGELEAAAQTAAEGRLSEPWSMNPGILRVYQRPWYRQLMEFPDVREKLADLERQRQQQRQATIMVLAELEQGT
jgi:tetratricopeptide (TPR) repeat protein